MSLLDKILGRPTPQQSAAPVQTVQAVFNRPVIDREALQRAGLQVGGWVITPEGAGIITGCTGTAVQANLVHPPGTPRTRTTGEVEDISGHNKVVLNADDKAVNALYIGDIGTVRRAYIDEIPVRGAENPTEHEPRLRAFGYILSREAAK